MDKKQVIIDALDRRFTESIEELLPLCFPFHGKLSLIELSRRVDTAAIKKFFGITEKSVIFFIGAGGVNTNLHHLLVASGVHPARICGADNDEWEPHNFVRLLSTDLIVYGSHYKAYQFSGAGYSVTISSQNIADTLNKIKYNYPDNDKIIVIGVPDPALIDPALRCGVDLFDAYFVEEKLTIEKIVSVPDTVTSALNNSAGEYARVSARAYREAFINFFNNLK